MGGFMTKDEIIEIANKVKLPHDYVNGEPMWLDKLEEFAKLVTEKEREACAKVCEKQYEYYGNDHIFARAIRARGQE
jgi:hypothetical protein